MACNGCFKVYPNIKEHEEQCPSCGFSYCQKCLHYKIFVKILNTEENICKKCARCSLKGEIHRIPPPEYYKRIVSTASRKGKKKEVMSSSPKTESQIGIESGLLCLPASKMKAQFRNIQKKINIL